MFTIKHRPLGRKRDLSKKRLFLAELYFNSYYREAVRIANLRDGDVVLDFGCNVKKLKKHLPNEVEYIGYDIFPEMSDIIDYKKLNKVDVVFAIHILEHLNDKELNEFINWLKKSSCRKIVLVMPLSTSLQKLLSFFEGYYFVNEVEHIHDWVEVYRRFEKNFKNTEMNSVWGFSTISGWKRIGFNGKKLL